MCKTGTIVVYLLHGGKRSTPGPLENRQGGCYAEAVSREARIRRATAADLPALVDLWLEKMALLQLSDTRTRLAPDADLRRLAAMKNWIEDRDFCLLVATRETRSEGYILGCEGKAEPGLLPLRRGLVLEMTLAMHSDLNGIGVELWAALRKWFGDRGLDEAIVEVSSRQPVEQAFWRSLAASELTDHLWLRT